MKRHIRVSLWLILTLALPSLASDQDVGDGPTMEQIMEEAAQNASKITAGLLTEDYGAINVAARAIAEQPRPPKATREKIKQTMGEELSRFNRTLMGVRTTAQELADAAEFEDLKEVQRLSFALMQGCLNCHNDYRRRLRATQSK